MRNEVHRCRLMPSVAQYARLLDARRHLQILRNAILQERVESYRCALAHAMRRGRDRPIAEDWMGVRHEEIAEFTLWQSSRENDLRRRHDQAEARRVAALRSKGEAAEPKPWRAQTAADFGHGINLAEQSRRIVAIRHDDPDGLGRLPLEVVREPAHIVDRSMTAFFKRVEKNATLPKDKRRAVGFPRFKSVERIRSFSCPLGRGITLSKPRFGPDGEDRRLFSSMWEGGLRIRFHRPLPSEPKSVRLVYDGRFWEAHFLCQVAEEEDIPEHVRPGTVVGVDLGIERMATLDDGSFEPNPQALQRARKKIRVLDRRVKRRKRLSKGWKDAKQALRRAHREVRNRRETSQHEAAKRIVSRFETVVVEDLRIGNMTRSASGTVEEPGRGVAQKRGLNRSLLDAALGSFVTKLIHKAERAGGRVVKVDPRGTSQRCSGCGEAVPKPLSQRWHACGCGASLHRDHNAARNIRRLLVAS